MVASLLLPRLLLLLALSGWVSVEGCANASIVQKLSSVLLAEYEREMRPSPSGGGDASPAPTPPADNAAAPAPAAAAAGTAQPTPVALELFVRHGRIDDTKGVAVLIADLYMAWSDPRLSWNASEWGVDALYVAAEALWRPDVALLNSAAEAEASAADEPARVAVSSGGDALWVPRLHLAAPCHLDLDAWPSDEHRCYFEFGSRIYTKNAIEYHFHEYKEGEMKEREAGAWAASITDSELLSTRREGGEFAAVRWRVAVRRRGGAHATLAHVVTAALVALLAGAALLPAEARAPLHAAAALAATAHLCAATLRLPPAGGAPRLLRLHAALLALAAASAALAAIVAHVARLPSHPPQPLRRLLLTTAALSGYRENERPEDGGGDGCSSAGRAHEWGAAARLLDVGFLATCALVALVLLAVYL